MQQSSLQRQEHNDRRQAAGSEKGPVGGHTLRSAGRRREFQSRTTVGPPECGFRNSLRQCGWEGAGAPRARGGVPWSDTTLQFILVPV